MANITEGAVDYAELFEYQPWFFSLLGSAMVGLSGVLPLFVIPLEGGAELKNGVNSTTLKVLLSFAVGGLLGDVFLHLLPEAWATKSLPTGTNHPPKVSGLWVLTGFLVFIIVEKIFSNEGCHEDENAIQELENNNSLNPVASEKRKIITPNGENYTNGDPYDLRQKSKNGYQNGFAQNGVKEKFAMANGNVVPKEGKKKHISGYLNLLANCIDNFTHGLAVGGSFLISFRLGVLTTFAILVHEIPHEIGDFAILLKSGFNRWDAAKAQLMTAFGGIAGALTAVLFSGNGIESKTTWILPFTAGSFLHIGMVSILPELITETSPKESMKQFGALLVGISLMAGLTMICD